MLKITGLRKTFGSLVAAEDIDLSVASGEAPGIIGPNVAGKTTLFNLIAGGLTPAPGKTALTATIVPSPSRMSVASPGSDARIRFHGPSRDSPCSRICWLPRCTAGG